MYPHAEFKDNRGHTVLVMPSVKRTNSIVSLVSRHSGRRVSMRFNAELRESALLYVCLMYRIESYGSNGEFSVLIPLYSFSDQLLRFTVHKRGADVGTAGCSHPSHVKEKDVGTTPSGKNNSAYLHKLMRIQRTVSVNTYGLCQERVSCLSRSMQECCVDPGTGESREPFLDPMPLLV
jgi:hypothetical protein